MPPPVLLLLLLAAGWCYDKKGHFDAGWHIMEDVQIAIILQPSELSGLLLSFTETELGVVAGTVRWGGSSVMLSTKQPFNSCA